MPMFRNRERMTRYLVFFVATMMILTLVLPFLASLGQ